MLEPKPVISLNPEDHSSSMPADSPSLRCWPIKKSIFRSIIFIMGTFTTVWALINGSVAALMLWAGLKLLFWGLAYMKTDPNIISYAEWLSSNSYQLTPALVAAARDHGFWKAVGHSCAGSLTVLVSTLVIWTSLEGFWFVGNGLFALSQKRT